MEKPNQLKPEVLTGVETQNYKVEIRPNVFFSVLFVDKNNMPLEKIKCHNKDLIGVLDKIAYLFINGIEIKIGMKLDFGVDMYQVSDIFINFKNENIEIEYSLF
jgi:hypothetical protein